MSYLLSGRLTKGLSVLLALFVLMITSIGAVAQSDVSASYIRLKYATFDPLQSEPFVPQSLRATNTTGANAYIVQFDGIIQDEWKDAVIKAGGKIEGYVPDNALLVQLDGESAAQLTQADHIRWVGVFQPAYKLAPQLEKATGHRYKIALANWANTKNATTAIASLVDDVDGEGTTLIVNASFEQLVQVAQLGDVMWIEEHKFYQTSNDVATGIMNVQAAWVLTYTGAGQIVTIADTGLDTGVDSPTTNGDMHLDFDNRVAHISSYPVQNFSGVTNVGADDGAADKDSGHGTHVAGSVAGNGARSTSNAIRGAAYQASITFQAVEQYTTFNDGTPNGYYLTGIPGDIKTLFLEAYGWGSRIHTNSWGSAKAGEYNSDSQNADQFTWDHKDFTILFAAGNEGVDANSNGYVDEDSIDTPATAKNVITIGASENVRASGGYQSGYGALWPSDFPANPTSNDTPSDSAEEMAAFSSRGPTDDGRIKPDLVAPGTNILSTKSSQTTSTGWGAYNNYYMYMGGTSMATPLAAGAATVVRDYLVDGEGVSNPGAALIKALLINTAEDISGYGVSTQEAGQPIPNNHEGWGRINIEKAISNTNRVFYEGAGLATGASHTYEFTLTKTISALKTTLVWTDFPGLPSASKQLVNDLNLTVTAPDGSTVYRGNHFSNGWTTSGGSADNTNNVENVYIQNPATGTWTIKVTALNVPQGPQPYALVIAGATSSTSPKPSKYIYLPLVLKGAGGSTATAPHGTVTYQGAPTSAGQMVMRYYNGSSWSTYATATIDSNGNYQFSSVPTLSSGQRYYVRWENSASNSSYLYTWMCNNIDTNSPTSSALQCDFDIENINLQSPAPNATVSLPYTFQWQRRTSTNDSYEFDLYNPNTTAWAYTPPLGYVNSYTLSSLPSGFNPGEQYNWFMWVYGVNGHGESYYYRNVTFSNSGRYVTIEDNPASTLKRIQEFIRPFQE